MNKPPFIIFGLPRSRTFWLSRFLSYGDWSCGHEEMRHARSLDDVKAWLSQPNTGTAETAAAPWWRLVRKMRPDVNAVVVRRPVADVVDSLMRTGLFADRAALTVLMRRLDAKLDQIERRFPGVLSVRFEELANETTCARVFENCLPYQHDPVWWRMMDELNLQIDLKAMIRYYQAYRAPVEKVTALAKQHSLDLLHRGRGFVPDGLEIKEEPFDAYFPGAINEIREHAIAIGEGAEYPNSMNFEAMRAHAEAGHLQTIIARSNGRVFGYILSVIQPAFIDKTITAAHHTTIWAHDNFPGLGKRLLRVANDALRAKGAGEIIFRAGMRGDGPRLGTLYKRLGAEPCGQLYRLDLRDAQ